MGMFDWITPGVGAIASGAMGLWGQQSTNDQNIQIANQNNIASAQQAAQLQEFNANQAQLNRDYQTQMSGTAYQRGVKDMEAAGLNPMLAYSQGGASTPGGAQATGAMGQRFTPQIQNPGQVAAAAAQSAAQIENTLADADLKKAQAETERNRPQNVQADTDYKRAMQGLTNTQQQQVIEQTNKVVSERQLTDAQTLKVIQETTNLVKQGAQITAQTINTAANTALQKAQTANTETQTNLARLKVPEASAYANFWKGEYGQTKPYVDYGLESVNSAASIVGKGKAIGNKGITESSTQRAKDGSTDTYTRRR
ncbi:MAG: DNA pilot protein [Microvirus sp.]|nr:MAG: DNA pilot protein [Microvirus sp.]